MLRFPPFSNSQEMCMSTKHYKLSFTSGGLLRSESLVIAEVYKKGFGWDATREQVISHNLLQARTESTLKTLFRECRTRLECLSEQEINYLLNADSPAQSQMLWLAVCRAYRFVGEFAAEVLHDRYTSLIGDLPRDCFDTFWEQKANWYPELDEVSHSTQSKLRQVLFLMMREASLLDECNIIQPCLLDSSLISLIKRKDAGELAFFPLFESDMQGSL